MHLALGCPHHWNPALSSLQDVGIIRDKLKLRLGLFHLSFRFYSKFSGLSKIKSTVLYKLRILLNLKIVVNQAIVKTLEAVLAALLVVALSLLVEGVLSHALEVQYLFGLIRD